MSYNSVATTILLTTLCVGACAQSNNAAQSLSVRHFVAPAYPASAWLAHVEGVVVTEVTVKRDGTVQSVKVVSAHPMFREPVESAIRQWLFQPILSEATALKVTTRFQLDAGCPLTGSNEPDKRYYIPTRVSADLPSSIEVSTCLPIVSINNKSHR